MLPVSDRLEVYEAICDYALDRIEPTFTTPMANILWVQLKATIDSQWTKFLNGTKGGCPKGTKKPTMNGNQNARKSENKTETKPNQNRDKTNSIVMYSKVKDKDNIMAATADKENNKFFVALREKFPTLAKFRSPLTEEEYGKLVADYGEQKVHEKMLALDNVVGAEKKYKSVNRTLRIWLKK